MWAARAVIKRRRRDNSVREVVGAGLHHLVRKPDGKQANTFLHIPVIAPAVNQSILDFMYAGEGVGGLFSREECRRPALYRLPETPAAVIELSPSGWKLLATYVIVICYHG